MLKMVSPEQVVLTESMHVGQRHLQDSGYSQTADNIDEDDSNLSIEQQLAPWITTKNFLFATQAKAMLRLHGEGDPTGRGEAFSFIRISMKDIFVKAGEDYEQKMGKPPYSTGISLILTCHFKAEAENRPKSAHRYNVAEQQLIYKSEIERIWKAQFDSLSRKDEPQLTAEDERRDKQQQLAIAAQMKQREATPMDPFSRASSADPGRDQSMDPEGSSRRVLRIKRFVCTLDKDTTQHLIFCL